MERATVARLFASDADSASIRERDAHSRKMGVTGVPTFVVSGQHVVAGAQPAALWTNVINELQTQQTKAG